MKADPTETALFLGAFFDELTRWGVRDVVVSPGSRSTPLAMVAYELSQRCPERLRLFVDVDERGAAFFALGMAKASGHPVAAICTSGTAVANYYPAVLEAESSRVPLLVLTGDRPPQLQGLGAPQTCDQLNAYGNHVRAFRQMPLPSGEVVALAFARQAAREACISAGGDGAESEPTGKILAGVCFGGPVHLNFPFDEPLKPNLLAEGLFEAGRTAGHALGAFPVQPRVQSYLGDSAEAVEALLRGSCALVLAGEGSVRSEQEARELLAWAKVNGLPVLADPLSGLRSFSDQLVIDNYDSALADASDNLMPQVVIRFGRHPISKRTTSALAVARPLAIVVDPLETRDFSVATDVFVSCKPLEFTRSMKDIATEKQHSFATAWIAANQVASTAIARADEVSQGFEGAFIRRVVELTPEDSCLFVANSMSIRALDTFYLKADKRLAVLCNRGLNGIDGTVSAAIGAAQSFVQTTLVTGDLTLLHDLNALALQRELRMQRERPENGTTTRMLAPSVVIVVLNNNGGGIFDMLPQQSEESYFERLFLTPQDIDFQAAARAFGVPSCEVETTIAFDQAYCDLLGTPGISLIEVKVPLSGIKERYQPYWSAS